MGFVEGVENGKVLREGILEFLVGYMQELGFYPSFIKTANQRILTVVGECELTLFKLNMYNPFNPAISLLRFCTK